MSQEEHSTFCRSGHEVECSSSISCTVMSLKQRCGLEIWQRGWLCQAPSVLVVLCATGKPRQAVLSLLEICILFSKAVCRVLWKWSIFNTLQLGRAWHHHQVVSVPPRCKARCPCRHVEEGARGWFHQSSVQSKLEGWVYVFQHKAGFYTPGIFKKSSCLPPSCLCVLTSVSFSSSIPFPEAWNE